MAKRITLSQSESIKVIGKGNKPRLVQIARLTSQADR